MNKCGDNNINSSTNNNRNTGNLKIFNIKKTKVYSLFLWIGFSYFKVAQPLQGDNFLLINKFLGVPGTHFIYLGKLKGLVNLGVT